MPEWFFAESLTAPFSYRALLTDIGLVQRTALVEDPQATIERLAAFLPFSDTLLDSLAAQLRALGCELAVCDISPLGLAAAARAGIPSVLIENFTWDWIYRAYLAAWPGFLPHVKAFEAIFNGATYRIQTAPACAPDPRSPIVPPVSRHPSLSAPEIRARLGVASDAPLVLITMGGVPWEHTALDRLAAQRDIVFVVPGAADGHERRGRLIPLPHHSGYHHPDLVHAADAVVGKLGYSTLAEVYAAGVPFGFVSRPDFPESAVLAEFAAHHLPALPVTAEEMTTGAILERTPELLALPRAGGSRPNGGAAAARILSDVI